MNEFRARLLISVSHVLYVFNVFKLLFQCFFTYVSVGVTVDAATGPNAGVGYPAGTGIIRPTPAISGLYGTGVG